MMSNLKLNPSKSRKKKKVSIKAAYKDFLKYSKNQKNHQIQDLVLEPPKIDSLLQMIIQNDDVRKSDEEVRNDIVGKYLSKMIQNSHNEGHNDFELNTGDYLIDWLGYKLSGTINHIGDKDPHIETIRLTINSNVGDWCGYGTGFSKFSIKGNVGDCCGEKVLKSQFSIKGNVAKMCGLGAEKSKFSINGNAGFGCGDSAKYSEFSINGNAGKDCGRKARYSEFSIKRDVGDDCGSGARESQFSIKGNAGDDCGWRAEYSKFFINGNVANRCGEKAINSQFFIKGNVGKDCGKSGHKSTFNFYDENTFKEISDPDYWMYYCYIRLLDKDDKKLKEKYIKG